MKTPCIVLVIEKSHWNGVRSSSIARKPNTQVIPNRTLQASVTLALRHSCVSVGWNVERVVM